MNDAVEKIQILNRFSGRPGLHRMRALCDALGNPQEHLHFIHIAGTNGKGSTATMLASIFSCAGYRTGLYTSPYLVRFHERIQIDGNMIDDMDLNRLFERVQQAVTDLTLPDGEQIGAFEFITALAFLYFVECDCDLVVLETGLGGIYDATNIISSPEAAIITSISQDHTAILGNTLSEIARNKAGIFKPNSLHITCPHQKDEVYAVFHDIAKDLIIAPAATLISHDLFGINFTWNQQTYHIPLTGLYQLDNVSSVLTAVHHLKQKGWNVSNESVRKGLSSTSIAGRFEVLNTFPRVILDGSHNPDGIVQLSNTIKSIHFTGKLYCIFGMCMDKQVYDSVKAIHFTADNWYLTPLQDPRTLPVHELAKYFVQQKKSFVTCTNCADAIRRVYAVAKPEDIILIFGSLYLVGEARQILCSDTKEQFSCL